MKSVAQRGASPASSTIVLVVALGALFGFRLFFGLTDLLFTEDETQIYLLGLRFHASGAWPYFGPDVVWTETQIPGALQALLVGLPFFVAPVPEAPYVVLNVLSMGALAFFAWYLGLRLPEVPKWLIWGWLFTLPWTLELSTHIINPSYVLPASLFFFAAFLEVLPPLRIGIAPVPLCYAVMGCALGWIAQVHMSWPLLLPFIVIAACARARQGWRPVAAAVLALAAGAAITGALLLPTWMKYGVLADRGTGENVFFHWREPISTFIKTLARLLSFSSYEVLRFIATGSARQIVFLQDHRWLVPPTALLWLVGLVHPAWMALTAFRRKSVHPDWPFVRWLMIATAVLVSSSFFFTVAWAQARSFYFVAPVAFIYAAYCWTFIDSPKARRLAAVVLATNVFLQTSLAVSRVSGPSIYMNRQLLVQAIQDRRPDLFAHRRPWGRDVTPDALSSSISSADATRDLVLGRVERAQHIRAVVAWNFVVHNRSSEIAYRDLLCETNYYDADGRVIETHREPVWLVIEPGETRRADLVDSAQWTDRMARAEIRIIQAEPLKAIDTVTRGGS